MLTQEKFIFFDMRNNSGGTLEVYKQLINILCGDVGC